MLAGRFVKAGCGGAVAAVVIGLALVAALVLLTPARNLVPVVAPAIPGFGPGDPAPRAGQSPPVLKAPDRGPQLPFVPQPSGPLDWVPNPSEIRFKLDPGASYPIPLVSLPANALVKATMLVAFNSRLSVGTPDVSVAVQGPEGVVMPKARVASGYPLSFVAERGGEYVVTIGNEHSRLNAKQVVVTFR